MAAPPDGALGVLTTKGDLLGVDTNEDVERVPIGADGMALVADAASVCGVKWNAVASGLPVGYVDGLGIGLGATPDTDVDIATGKCRDGADSFDIIVGSVLTAVNTASGADGLDTGAVAADTFYSVWVIADSAAVEPVASLLSLSATAPTMPTGYDKKRRVGWILTDATSDNINFQQVWNGRVRRYWWDADSTVNLVLNSGSATTFTDVDLSAFVPPTSQNAWLLAEFKGSGSHTLALRPNGFSFSATRSLLEIRPGITNTSAMRTPVELGCPGQLIEYKVTNAANDAFLSAAGFDDEI